MKSQVCFSKSLIVNKKKLDELNTEFNAERLELKQHIDGVQAKYQKLQGDFEDLKQKHDSAIAEIEKLSQTETANKDKLIDMITDYEEEQK